MKKPLRATLAVFVASIAFLATTVATAPQALAVDVGNGKTSCNGGEICFGRTYPVNKYQRHYYYSAAFNGATYTNVDSGTNTSISVLNTISSVYNRDSTCSVALIDYVADGTVKTQNYSNRPDTFIYVGAAMDNKADAFKRIAC